MYEASLDQVEAVSQQGVGKLFKSTFQLATDAAEADLLMTAQKAADPDGRLSTAHLPVVIARTQVQIQELRQAKCCHSSWGLAAECCSHQASRRMLPV